MKKKIAYVFMLLVLAAIGVYEYFGIHFAMDQINMYQWLLQIIGIGCVSFTVVIAMFVYNLKNKINVAHTLSSLLLVVFLVVSSLNFYGYYDLPQKETVPNFYNTNIQEVKDWAKNYNIEIIEKYENSDEVAKYSVFGQDVSAGTVTSDVEKMEVVISDGPNYDKSLIVPQMLGWTIDEVKEYMNQNFLNNVKIKFKHSEEEAYVVIEQDKYGQMFRRDALNLVFSINENQLKDIAMIDLKNSSEFDATLWLMQNGIPYTITRVFSNDIDRNYVVNQNINIGDIVNKDSKVELEVSKGKEIVVGNLLNMTVEEVTQWVIDNKLDITFTDTYDDSVALGGIVKANYKEGDIIEEGTLIKLVTSKGQLKMEEFNSLSIFKAWASTYGIKYNTTREFNTSIKKGGIIKFSHNVGDIIKNGDTITVTVSKGKAITVPNFVGMSKSSIKTKCSELGLGCSFSYGSYGNTKKDVATSQSVSSGSKVESGTSINVVLSKGPAKEYTLYFSNALLGNSYTASVNSLKSYFEKNYPGVTFKFVAKSHASLAPGNIHENSPVKPGTKVVQGKSYTIYIVK